MVPNGLGSGPGSTVSLCDHGQFGLRKENIIHSLGLLGSNVFLCTQPSSPVSGETQETRAVISVSSHKVMYDVTKRRLESCMKSRLGYRLWQTYALSVVGSPGDTVSTAVCVCVCTERRCALDSD